MRLQILELKSSVLPGDFRTNSVGTEYERTIVRRYDNLELLGLPVKRESTKRYSLSVAYVSLLLAENDREITVEELLSTKRHILLRGIAGSGKTTVLQWIAVQAASASFEEGKLSAWNFMSPLFIRLRSASTRLLVKCRRFANSSRRRYRMSRRSYMASGSSNWRSGLYSC